MNHSPSFFLPSLESIVLLLFWAVDGVLVLPFHYSSLGFGSSFTLLSSTSFLVSSINFDVVVVGAVDGGLDPSVSLFIAGSWRTWR